MPGGIKWYSFPLEIRQKILLDYLRSCVVDAHSVVHGKCNSSIVAEINARFNYEPELDDPEPWEGTLDFVLTGADLDLIEISSMHLLKHGAAACTIFTDDDLRHPLKHFIPILSAFLDNLSKAGTLHDSLVKMAQERRHVYSIGGRRIPEHFSIEEHMAEIAAQDKLLRAVALQTRVADALRDSRICQTIFAERLNALKSPAKMH